MTEFQGGIPEISMEGFQVVSGDLFSNYGHTKAPTCSLWPTSIGFGQVAINTLNGCERIRIEINPSTKCLLAIPVTDKDKDFVRWTSGGKEPKARKIDCKYFTAELYKKWGLNPSMNYRASGVLVSFNQQVMLMFDFNKAESWYPKDKKAVNSVV